MAWLSTEDAAKLEKVSERTIRRNIDEYDYRHVNGIGGNRGIQYEISLSSLSPEAQARYNGEQQKLNEDVLLSLTNAQRETVYSKLAAVESYQEFKATYPKADKLQAFLRQYNEQHPDEPLSKRQLNHWENLYNRDGIAGLVDRRGGYNKGQSSIQEDEKNVFLTYWMQEKGNRQGKGGPSITSCYRLTQAIFSDRQLASVYAFGRLTRSIPYPALVLARQGKKAFADKCEPYLKFDYRSICTNQVWCADNHVFDLWAKDESGRVFRPWLIGWIDKRSRRIVGYQILDFDPNADAILDSFAKAVFACGIPEIVQLDNGADYNVHDLFNRDNAMSMANEMALSVTNAIPYNAKAKLIERFFNTLEYSYCIHLPSYFGADPKRRPEKMQQACDKLRDVAIPFGEFCTYISSVIAQYNTTVHSGDAMDGKTPNQAFVDNIVTPIKTANPALLSMYFKRTSKLLPVGRNGIRIPELQQYYSADELLMRQGKKVYARYNTNDVRQVYCFSEEGDFLCIAESVALGTLDQAMTAQNLRQMNAKKKRLRKLAREYVPNIAVPSVQQLAIQGGMSFETPDLKVLPTTPTVDSAKQNKAKDIQKAEQRQKAEKKESPRRKAQRVRDEAYFKFVTGGLKDVSGK